jgi:hypothetical protein
VIEKDQVFSDDDVVRSVREGNTRNFETLIDRYKNKIINFIHKMIYDYDEAQSLSQDVFLKVYETINRYEMQGNFQAFIFNRYSFFQILPRATAVTPGNTKTSISSQEKPNKRQWKGINRKKYSLPH